MAFINNYILDKALSAIKSESEKVMIVDTTSTDYATVIGAKLGENTVQASNFAIKDDTSSAGGRTITFTSPDINITKDGTVKQIVLVNETDTEILVLWAVQAERDVKVNDAIKPDPVDYSISKGI